MNLTTNWNDEVDEILHASAKRIEAIPRGKTYGWEDEKQAILSLFREMVEEIIGEDDGSLGLGYDEKNKLNYIRDGLRAEQRANLLQQLGEKK